MESLVENETFDVPNPEDDLSRYGMGLHCHQVLEAKIEKGRNVPDYQPADRGLEADHIPLVHPDARHLLSRAELQHEPLDPEPEVDDDEDGEEGEEEAEHVELVGLALIQGTAIAVCTLEQADPSSHRLRRESKIYKIKWV